MKKSQETAEIKITDSSDWKIFDAISKNLQKDLFAKCIEVCDGLDQAYYDFDLDGTIVTLHLEHYLGISIFLKNPEEATEVDLNNLATLKEYFDKHQEPNKSCEATGDNVHS